MIVVVGSPAGRIVDGRVALAGIAAEAARAAAAAGATVQLVGRVGDDPAADTLLLGLATAGVGHVAVLRDPTRPTPIADEVDAEGPGEELDPGDPATERATAADGPIDLDGGDVDLGLRYLTDFNVLVLVPPATESVARIAIEGARWASARLVLVVDHGTPAAVEVPPDAIVLQAPADDPNGAFASVVGRLAAALDAGGSPEDAFARVVAGAGWSTASGT